MTAPQTTEITKQSPKSPSKMKPGLVQAALYFGIFAVSILFWECILRFEISKGLSNPYLFFLLFIPAEALLLTAISGFFPPKGNRIFVFATLLILAVFYGAQAVYYRIFGSLISVSVLGMGQEAIATFGWTTRDVFIRSIALMLTVLIPPAAFLAYSFFKKAKIDRYPAIWHLFVLLLSVALWLLATAALRFGGTGKQSAYDLFHSTGSDTDTTASRVGVMTTFLVETAARFTGENASPGQRTVQTTSLPLYPRSGLLSDKTAEEDREGKKQVLDAFDFDALAKKTDDPELREIYVDFANRSPSYTNAYTGMLDGYNLILICAEGFWTYAIDENVTPTLYRMSQNGIILHNYYNSFRNTTVNGEYALSTGLWPDVSRLADHGSDVGSMPQSAAKFMPLGPGTIFANEGAATYAFHNYLGRYYRRSYSWRNLGYEHISFMDEGMHFSTTWPSSDDEMMRQSVDQYIGDDRFMAYYMTFSGHGPYNETNCIVTKNLDEVKRRLGPKADQYGSEALGYLAANLELEYGMEYLLKRLEEEGKSDNTLIVLAGDHYPYYLREQGRNELAGRTLSKWDIHHSTCIMYTTGLSDKIESEAYCCNVDILPTILNLFGIPYDSRLFMGRDIFSPGDHKAVLYDKSFMDNNAVYTASTGQVDWKIDTQNVSPDELQVYITHRNKQIDADFQCADDIIRCNLYFRIWEDAGFLSKDEADREIKREEAVADQMLLLDKEDAKKWEDDLREFFENL